MRLKMQWANRTRRFSLRSLLLLMLGAAAVSWVYITFLQPLRGLTRPERIAAEAAISELERLGITSSYRFNGVGKSRDGYFVHFDDSSYFQPVRGGHCTVVVDDDGNVVRFVGGA